MKIQSIGDFQETMRVPELKNLYDEDPEQFQKKYMPKPLAKSQVTDMK